MAANVVGNAPIGEDDGTSFIQRLMTTTWKASTSAISIGRAQLENLLQHVYDSARSATVEEMHHEYAERAKMLDAKEKELAKKESDQTAEDLALVERAKEAQSKEEGLDKREKELGEKNEIQEIKERELNTGTETLAKDITRGQTEVGQLRDREKILRAREELVKQSVHAIQIFAIAPTTDKEALDQLTQFTPLIPRVEPFNLQEIQQMLDTKHVMIERCRVEIRDAWQKHNIDQANLDRYDQTLKAKKGGLDQRENALIAREKEQPQGVQDMDIVSHNGDEHATGSESRIAPAMNASTQEPSQPHTTAQPSLASNSPMQPMIDNRPPPHPTPARGQRKRGRAPSPEDSDRNTRQRLLEEPEPGVVHSQTPPADGPQTSMEESELDVVRSHTPPADVPQTSLEDLMSSNTPIVPRSTQRSQRGRNGGRGGRPHRNNRGNASSGPTIRTAGSITKARSNQNAARQAVSSTLPAKVQQVVAESVKKPAKKSDVMDLLTSCLESATTVTPKTDKDIADMMGEKGYDAMMEMNKFNFQTQDRANKSHDARNPNLPRLISAHEDDQSDGDEQVDGDGEVMQSIETEPDQDAEVADPNGDLMPLIETEPGQDDEVTNREVETMHSMETGSPQDESEDEEEEL